MVDCLNNGPKNTKGAIYRRKSVYGIQPPRKEIERQNNQTEVI